jgi:hypothetical protein
VKTDPSAEKEDTVYLQDRQSTTLDRTVGCGVGNKCSRPMCLGALHSVIYFPCWGKEGITEEVNISRL